MAQPQQVEIGALSLEQLNGLKQQFEEELQVLSDSFQQLRMANNRFIDSKNCLKVLTKENEGSLYVSAKLTDVDSILVDIGTGYYAKKTIPQAVDYTDRKVKVILENLEKVSQAIAVKRKNLETVLMVMQQKIDEAKAQ